MKKLLILTGTLAILSLASCKKDYVCECTTTSNGQTSAPDQTTLVGVSKGTARANCLSTESSYVIAGTTYKYTNNCNLK